MRQYNAKIQGCTTPLRRQNEDYQLAIKQYQPQRATVLAREIAQNRACIAENTVYYREHLLYHDMMQNSQTKIQKRITYLEAHRERIAQHYEILKPQLLRELYTVSQTLQANF